MKRILWMFIATVAGAAPASAQAKWEPNKFKDNERYEYKIALPQDEKAKELFYAVEVKSTGKKDESGEELVELSYTTRSTVKKSELGERTAFGGGEMAGYSAMWAMSSAMYAAYFKDLEMKEGEKLSLFGMGTLKVTGKVKIADRDGFICKLFTKKDDKEFLQIEWAIDPGLALPLKTVWYEDDGKPKHSMELVSYKKP